MQTFASAAGLKQARKRGVGNMKQLCCGAVYQTVSYTTAPGLGPR